MVGRSRQTPHPFAFFVAQFAPRAQAAGATARTLIAGIHFKLSLGTRFVRTRRGCQAFSRTVLGLAPTRRHKPGVEQCPETRDAPPKQATPTGPISNAVNDRLNAAARNPNPAPESPPAPVSPLQTTT